MRRSPREGRSSKDFAVTLAIDAGQARPVAAGAAPQYVASRVEPAADPVRSRTARDHIRARSSGSHVRAGPTDDEVVPDA